MTKRRRDPESNGGTASASGFKAIFVSTSLDTHLAMTLSLSDTVADFKKKIMLQHEQCFPETGPLTIHSLKVEHQGKMFQLVSDTVVGIAFEECEGRWDLFVDASSSSEVVKEQNVLVPCNKDKLEGSRLLLASDATASKSPGESSKHSLDVGNVDGTLKPVENDLNSKENSKIQNEKLPLRKPYETRSRGGSNAKKKQKVKHGLDGAGESSLDATRTSPQTTMSTRSNNEVGGIEDSVVHASPKVSTDVQLGERDAGASPQNTMFYDAKTSEQAEPESHVFGKDPPSIRDSDLKTKSLEKSVAELEENMTSPDVPSLQVQEEQPAISTSTTKKVKKKKKHQETNSSVPFDNAATSKPGTVLQGSVHTEEACEGQILGSGNHGLVNDESLLTSTGNLQNIDHKEDGCLSSNHKAGMSENDKPPDSVEKAPAMRETVICIGMVDKFPEAGVSKSKIRNSKKSAVRKLDQFDVDHDLSAPSKVCVAVEGAALTGNIDQSCRDENVLPENDPKKSDENSEVAKNKVPRAVSTGRSNKHLDSDERNLNEMESRSDMAFNVRDDPEGGKSGHRLKKKKTKTPTSKDSNKDANDLKSLSAYIPDDVIADQSIFSRIEGGEEPKMISPTNSHKNGDGKTAPDYDDVHFPLSEAEHNQSRNEDLDLMSECQDRATVQGQVNMEQAIEVECPMDQPDEEEPKNKGSEKRKRKKKAKRAGNSIGDGLGIPEVNQENVGDEELPSLVENGNGKTASDYDDVHFPLSQAEHNPSINEDFDFMSDSQDRATVQGQVNMEQAKEAESPMDQPDEEQKNKGTEKKKSKKKAKRVGNSTGDSLGIPEVNQESVGDEDLASLVEKSPDLNYTNEKRTVDQSGVSGLGLGKNSGLKGTTENEQHIQNRDSPDVPAHEIESNHEDIHATNIGLESPGEKGSVNFRHYFVPGDDHRGASTNKFEGESIAVEGAQKANEQTPERKRKPSKSSGNHKNSSVISMDAKSHERPLKAKPSKSVSEMGTSTNSRKKLKSLSTTKDANVKPLKKSVDPARVTVPRRSENNGSLFSSNIKSASRDSKKTLLNKSNQKKQTGIKNKNSAQGKTSGKKDLLTGSLFGNDSSSSDDENGTMKSASSTQSRSDSSSSSSSEDLMSGGSTNKGRKTPFGLANQRNMSMDMIMKRSSRFKKAKLTASQTEPDSELVDFVPETQP